MAQRGNGAIINLGSWIARIGIPVSAVYSSTKGALETLTRDESMFVHGTVIDVDGGRIGVAVITPS